MYSYTLIKIASYLGVSFFYQITLPTNCPIESYQFFTELFLLNDYRTIPNPPILRSNPRYFYSSVLQKDKIGLLHAVNYPRIFYFYFL